MADVIIPNNPTLIDWAKATDPNGNISAIVELLSQTNEILQDCVFKEGNLPTGERVVIRTGLPEVYWRSLNQGIPASKATTAQVDEACGMLEARSEVDVDLAKLNGNTQAFRLSQDVAFLEAMNIKQANTLFYGDPSKNPKEYLGLAPRYSKLTGAENSQNVLSAGSGVAAGGNTSIYLVCWGDHTVYCPFPKGSDSGLTQKDLGEQTVYTNTQESLQAYTTRYQWKSGLVVKDWRYVVRICDINVDDLVAGTGTQDPGAATSIIKMMIRSLYRLPSRAMGRPAFYMNRTTHAGLSIQAMDKTQSVLKIHEGVTQFGAPHSWLSFLGVPLRIADAIGIDEPALNKKAAGPKGPVLKKPKETVQARSNVIKEAA